MATTLYHATPAANRDSIFKYGLDINRGRRMFVHDDEPEEDEAEGRYPRGIYLIDFLEAARNHGCWHFDECDVWRVDMTGLHLALDRDIDGQPSGQSPYGGQAFFTYDVVPVERLSLAGKSLIGVWAS